MAEPTPMKKQYNEIKAKYQDCMLFFRLGDFYEMFDDDAKIASRELDIALTTRDRNVENPEERTPMCGVPYHAAEVYIAKLVSKGYKVAICEQTEDPALAKGIVKRDVIRIITPGTVTAGSMLDENRSNYICSVYFSSKTNRGGIAFCEVSTGEFCTAAFDYAAADHIINELGRFAPREAVLNSDAASSEIIRGFLTNKLSCLVQCLNDSFDHTHCEQLLCRQFNTESVGALGLQGVPTAVQAAGALLDYVITTQKADLSYLKTPDLFTAGRFMELDYTTRRNLELTETLRSGEKKGSLLWVLDKTKTPMGGRTLRSWLERPLLDPEAIRYRSSAVEELVNGGILRDELRDDLRGVGDMQRIIGRIVFGTANARDLAALANYCRVLPTITARLKVCTAPALQRIAKMDVLEDVCAVISNAIAEEPPLSVREGGMIRKGYNAELDELREVRAHGAEMMAAIEQKERERTGIKKLKIGYNKVFGYYIDVPRSAGERNIPEDYIRKQTLVNNERYFTTELKDLETKLMSAKDRIEDMEYRFFTEIRDMVAAQTERVQAAGDAVGVLDVLCALADVAVRNRYVCPEMNTSGTLYIEEGRHPVVEAAQKDNFFVPNSLFMNNTTDSAMIITGPNMAGKSTYMRQTALIVLMAQIGSFVPAKKAVLGVVDRVFTRIGASDDLASGQSTFMVEMSEVANILKNATKHSLILLDEIGRGTSTYDGMAIARAVLEYCADRRKLGAKTMFATHYHELTSMSEEFAGIKNYHVSAKNDNGDLIFQRTVKPGAADRSYGVAVAKLAGVPESVVRRANVCLQELEEQKNAMFQTPDLFRYLGDAAPAAAIDPKMQAVMDMVLDMNPDNFSPIAALNFLYELKKRATTDDE
ncbi:MAG: DNA mismatch repair protein MutS [Oscillospiraceae bacterium]|nr:DNA mismatch repair protein MutS [Oscillospiraceae bacterium]